MSSLQAEHARLARLPCARLLYVLVFSIDKGQLTVTLLCLVGKERGDVYLEIESMHLKDVEGLMIRQCPRCETPAFITAEEGSTSVHSTCRV